MLNMLSSHVVTILDSELDLQELQEEVASLQDSEIHLKQIFEHSLTSFILVNPEMTVKVFNTSADKFIRLQNNNLSGITDSANLLWLLPADKIQFFSENIEKALECAPVFVQHMHVDNGDNVLWWELKFTPAYNMFSVITGVVIEAEDISDRIR